MSFKSEAMNAPIQNSHRIYDCLRHITKCWNSIIQCVISVWFSVWIWFLFDVLNLKTTIHCCSKTPPGFALLLLGSPQYNSHRLCPISLFFSPLCVPEGLKEYFCKYGEVKECMVMRDPVTKRSRWGNWKFIWPPWFLSAHNVSVHVNVGFSVTNTSPLPHVCRGFGFVTFVDQAGVDKVLAQTRHELDSKTVSSLIPLASVWLVDFRIIRLKGVTFIMFTKVPLCWCLTPQVLHMIKSTGKTQGRNSASDKTGMGTSPSVIFHRNAGKRVAPAAIFDLFSRRQNFFIRLFSFLLCLEMTSRIKKVFSVDSGRIKL